MDPTRTQRPENEEQTIHPLYAYLYVADARKAWWSSATRSTAPTGRACRRCSTANPTNNFLERALTFNPDGLLTGAVNITIAGHYAYVSLAKGLVVVDLDDPLQPRIVATVGEPHLKQPRAVAVQFRYAFVSDRRG